MEMFGILALLAVLAVLIIICPEGSDEVEAIYDEGNEDGPDQYIEVQVDPYQDELLRARIGMSTRDHYG